MRQKQVKKKTNGSLIVIIKALVTCLRCHFINISLLIKKKKVTLFIIVSLAPKCEFKMLRGWNYFSSPTSNFFQHSFIFSLAVTSKSQRLDLEIFYTLLCVSECKKERRKLNFFHRIRFEKNFQKHVLQYWNSRIQIDKPENILIHWNC